MSVWLSLKNGERPIQRVSFHLNVFWTEVIWSEVELTITGFNSETNCHQETVGLGLAMWCMTAAEKDMLISLPVAVF